MNRKNTDLGREGKTIIYLMFMVIGVIGFSLISAVVIYLVTGCWPISSVGVAPCMAHLFPSLFVFMPILLGTILGGFLAYLTLEK
jgi:hypothetical protein